MEKSIKIPASFILDRYSPYAFSSEAIPEEKLEERKRTRKPIEDIAKRGRF